MSKAKEPKTYEDRIARLEELISLLEKGDLPLEETVSYYKEAMSLTAQCAKQLEEYRQQITVIRENGEEVPLPDAL